MRIYCQHCGQVLEVYDEIADGQHILCPYCNKKFSFSKIEPSVMVQSGTFQKHGVTAERLSREFDWMQFIKVLAVILGLCLLAIIINKGEKMKGEKTPDRPREPDTVECVSCGSLVSDTVANRVNLRTIRCPVCGKLFKHKFSPFR